jgi:hypothetical protein
MDTVLHVVLEEDEHDPFDVAIPPCSVRLIAHNGLASPGRPRFPADHEKANVANGFYG